MAGVKPAPHQSTPPLKRLADCAKYSAMRRILQLTLLALVLIGIGQLCWQYNQLPARVATHFDFEGRPNGWMSRESHVTQAILFTVIIAGALSVLSIFLGRIPDKLINLPYREYWLAEPRRAESLHWLSNLILGIACAAIALIDVVFYGIYRANQNAAPRFAFPLTLSLGVFGGVLISLIVAALLRFRRPAQ
jgi:hypothetical protein